MGRKIFPYRWLATEVGDDLYEFFELDNRQVGFLVGDTVDKDVPAALVMSAICALLRGTATDSGSSSPGEEPARVNETMLVRIPLYLFVTCFSPSSTQRTVA